MAPELDIEQPDALVRYLRRSGRIGADEQPTVTVLAGGVSNRTVLVERQGQEHWVLKQALAKLRVAADWYSSPERIRREALGLRWLAELAPPGASMALRFEDHEHHLLAMTAVPQPHENWKVRLLGGGIEPDHIMQFALLLGQVHRRSYERRAELEPVFRDRSFFESLRVEPYYRYTAAQVPEARHFYDGLIDEAAACRLALVHGDYSPKNVLIFGGRLILLDHEVIHFGDPAFDLGFSLTHLLSKAHHLPAQRAAFAEGARLYWHSYRTALGELPWTSELEPRAVKHTLGCLLARVAGRSPLEYLDPTEQVRQQQVTLELMARPPLTIERLIEAFVAQIEALS